MQISPAQSPIQQLPVERSKTEPSVALPKESPPADNQDTQSKAVVSVPPPAVEARAALPVERDEQSETDERLRRAESEQRESSISQQAAAFQQVARLSASDKQDSAASIDTFA